MKSAARFQRNLDTTMNYRRWLAIPPNRLGSIVAPAVRGALARLRTSHRRLQPRWRGQQFPLNNQDANIGRWDADGGVFPDVDLDSDDPEAKVSRRHARISLRDGQYIIEDLGSTNGTFVNRGHRLAPGDRQPLKDGDEIIVGKTFLRFRVAR